MQVCKHLFQLDPTIHQEACIFNKVATRMSTNGPQPSTRSTKVYRSFAHMMLHRPTSFCRTRFDSLLCINNCHGSYYFQDNRGLRSAPSIMEISLHHPLSMLKVKKPSLHSNKNVVHCKYYPYL